MATRTEMKEALKEALEALKEAKENINVNNVYISELKRNIEVLKKDSSIFEKHIIRISKKSLEKEKQNKLGIRGFIVITAFIFGGIFSYQLGIISSGNNRKETVIEFNSDGCSMFPDGNYSSCCVEHDKAYYKGGTYEQKESSDMALQLCVLDKTKNKLLSATMRLGVKIGGTPLLPTPWRWGFGREYLQSLWYDRGENK